MLKHLSFLKKQAGQLESILADLEVVAKFVEEDGPQGESG